MRIREDTAMSNDSPPPPQPAPDYGWPQAQEDAKQNRFAKIVDDIGKPRTPVQGDRSSPIRDDQSQDGPFISGKHETDQNDGPIMKSREHGFDHAKLAENFDKLKPAGKVAITVAKAAANIWLPSVGGHIPSLDTSVLPSGAAVVQSVVETKEWVKRQSEIKPPEGF
jgi:hypothetical protein